MTWEERSARARERERVRADHLVDKMVNAYERRGWNLAVDYIAAIINEWPTENGGYELVGDEKLTNKIVKNLVKFVRSQHDNPGRGDP
jgi:hypothetical protein